MVPQLGSIDDCRRGYPRRRCARGGELPLVRSPRRRRMIWSVQVAAMALQLGSIDGRGRGYEALPRRPPLLCRMIWSFAAMALQLGSREHRRTGRNYTAAAAPALQSTAAASAQYSELPPLPSASGEGSACGKRKGERLRFWLRMGARTRCRARFSVAGSAKRPQNAQSQWPMGDENRPKYFDAGFSACKRVLHFKM